MVFFKDCIDNYKKTVHKSKNSREVIDLDLLEEWLSEIERTGNERIEYDIQYNIKKEALAHRKWEIHNERRLKIWEAKYNSKNKTEISMFDSVIKTGMLALKTSLTINAGAATAFLSFIGYLLVRGNFELVSLKSLSEVLASFGWGAFCAALSTGGMYFAQFFYNRNVHENAGKCFHFSTIILIIASYWFFFDGLIKSRDAFLEVDTKINQNISIITEPYYYINKDSL